ncbi:ABC transporter substrate-binding protein [Rhizobium halophytocola]|uniref:Peptide/nickel transport system substrate-binding protein n=1 Tax=Rhizobium halophytocola TaxID=735519 RepID=A0ABS4E1Z3_9HYPH|nr:ABC transporter substrate-binding protein [Rhizobium halophytocola]MBP1851941.1 peptide/nickel transport system substrate-binding protein [Rhizobium halophytocola]
MKLKSIFALAFAALTLGTAPLAHADGAKGGVLTIATIGEPPTLDQMQTPTDIVIMITQHIFETLYTFDAHWEPKPLLAADMPKISEDGLTYTIPLRKGVKFQDGSDMTPADVVASLDRFMKINSKGKQVAEVVDSIKADGDNAVVVTLKSRYAPFIAVISQAAVIMPKADATDTLTKFIGTGPYMLKDHKPDQYIQLVRYDGYTSPEGETSMYAGKREALADELRFVPVPDANTRVEGLLAGQYDFADSLPVSAYDRLASSDKAEPVILKNSGWMCFFMNMKEGIMANKDLRNAVQAALNPSDMMAAAFGDEKFYSVDGAFYPEGSVWHTEDGVARYGEGDPETAADLMKKAGYDGKPIRLMVSRQYEFHYKAAEVAKAYLEAAGFKVDMQVVDWATLTTRRADPTSWDIFFTHANFPGDPTMLNPVNDNYPGWYTSDEKKKTIDAYLAAVGQDEKVAAWAKMQAAFYDDAPLFKVGNFNALTGVSKAVKGYNPYYWPSFWNVEAKK